MPANADAAQPVWGIEGGIAVGLWPMSGPRGLLRIHAPYLGQPVETMINFIAIEPVVGADRELSELESSVRDGVPGKAMWSGDDFETEPRASEPWQPAQGRIMGRGDEEALVVYVFVERFANGAEPVVELTLG